MALPLTLRLSWRSFLRHKRRSIITSAAIAVGLAMMLSFVGIADDAHDRMAELGIRAGGGHVVVQGAGYHQTKTLEHVVANPAPILERARALEGVVDAVPRVHAFGLLSTGDESAPVALVGVDPKRERKVSNIPADGKRVAGHYLRARADMPYANQPADIYIGTELAKNLSVEVGDRLLLTVSPKGGARPRGAAFLVRGIFRTGMTEVDAGYVEVPITAAQELLALGAAVTQVAVLLDGLPLVAPATAALKQALAADRSLEILPWQEALRELYDAIVLDDGGLYVMMTIIFIIVALGIFNTMLMSVVERTREFGVMMALGTSGRRLAAVVMVEAVLLAFVGAAVGLAIGLSLHSWAASTGIDMATLFGVDYEMAGIVIEGGWRIYSRLSTAVVIKWTAVIVAMVIAAGIYPALRAARLEPVEAMRHV